MSKVAKPKKLDNQIIIRVSKSIHDLIKRKAAEDDRSISTYCRLLMETALKG